MSFAAVAMTLATAGAPVTARTLKHAPRGLRAIRNPKQCDHCKRHPDKFQNEFICRGCGARLGVRIDIEEYL